MGAFQALPKATVKFGDQLIRVYGDTAVNTGYYTFSYTKDGETKSIPARYSFTYVKDGNDMEDRGPSFVRDACATEVNGRACRRLVATLRRIVSAAPIARTLRAPPSRRSGSAVHRCALHRIRDT